MRPNYSCSVPCGFSVNHQVTQMFYRSSNKAGLTNISCINIALNKYLSLSHTAFACQLGVEL